MGGGLCGRPPTSRCRGWRVGGLHQRLVELLRLRRADTRGCGGRTPAHGTGAVQPPETVVGRCDGHDLDVGLAGGASRGFVGSLRLAEVRYANELPRHSPRGGVGNTRWRRSRRRGRPTSSCWLRRPGRGRGSGSRRRAAGHRHGRSFRGRSDGRRRRAAGQGTSLEVGVGDHHRCCDSSPRPRRRSAVGV